MSSVQHRHIEIVSPGVPCGATYLLNILLELKAPIYTAKFNLFWQRDREGRWRANSILQKKFSIWLPSLAKEFFEFSDDAPRIHWHHQWPYPQLAGIRRVIFVRDPRDTLFSQHKRLKRQDSIDQFLSEPVAPFGLNRIEKYILQIKLWEALSNEDETLIVRFEDLKSAPEHELDRILNFCGMQRSNAEIEKAVESSQTDRVKKHHDAILSSAGVKSGTVGMIRRGLPYEWKNNPERNDLALYRTRLAQDFLRSHGYECDQECSSIEQAAHSSQTSLVNEAWRTLYGQLKIDQDAKERATRELMSVLLSKSNIKRSPVNFLSVSAKGRLRLYCLVRAVFAATFLKRVLDRSNSRVGSLFDKFIYEFQLGER